MAETKYTYSIANDFPGGKANTANLHSEIQASAITIHLVGVNTCEDVLDIIFEDSLPSEDKTVLDGDTSHPAGGIIAAHDNTPTCCLHGVKFGITYYLDDSSGDLEGFNQLLRSPNTSIPEVEDHAASSGTEVEIEHYASVIGDPGITLIPAGIWEINAWAHDTGGNNSHLVVRVFKRTYPGGVETQLFRVQTDNLTATYPVDPYALQSVQPDIILDSTDRIIARFYAYVTLGTYSVYYTHNGTARYTNLYTPLVNQFGFSGQLGISGASGLSGTSGFSGTYSGFSGWSGISGESGASGWSGWSGISSWSGCSGFSGRMSLNLEMELEFKEAYLLYYKEFGYTGDDLTSIDIYTDASKGTKLFSKLLSYAVGVLSSTVLTRMSDLATLTKNYAYADGKLVSITCS